MKFVSLVVKGNWTKIWKKLKIFWPSLHMVQKFVHYFMLFCIYSDMSMMELFAKIVNGYKPLLDVWQGPKFASVLNGLN